MPESCPFWSPGEKHQCGNAGKQRAVNQVHHSARMKIKHLAVQTFPRFELCCMTAGLRGNITFLPPCSSQEHLQTSEGSFPNRWNNDLRSAASGIWCFKFCQYVVKLDSALLWIWSTVSHSLTFKPGDLSVKTTLFFPLSPLKGGGSSHRSLPPKRSSFSINLLSGPPLGLQHQHPSRDMSILLSASSKHLKPKKFIYKHDSTDENWPRFIGLLCKSELCGRYHLGWADCIYWLQSLWNSCKDKMTAVLECINFTILFFIIIFTEVFFRCVFLG